MYKYRIFGFINLVLFYALFNMTCCSIRNSTNAVYNEVEVSKSFFNFLKKGDYNKARKLFYIDNFDKNVEGNTYNYNLMRECLIKYPIPDPKNWAIQNDTNNEIYQTQTYKVILHEGSNPKTEHAYIFLIFDYTKQHKGILYYRVEAWGLR